MVDLSVFRWSTFVEWNIINYEAGPSSGAGSESKVVKAQRAPNSELPLLLLSKPSMAAPQIPNLFSLRGRGGGRGRGRRGGPSADEDPEVAKAKQDQIIQQTDTDANISRLSAVEAGYLDDPFAIDFAPSPAPAQGIRRFPIINRGTPMNLTSE